MQNDEVEKKNCNDAKKKTMFPSERIRKQLVAQKKREKEGKLSGKTRFFCSLSTNLTEMGCKSAVRDHPPFFLFLLQKKYIIRL